MVKRTIARIVMIIFGILGITIGLHKAFEGLTFFENMLGYVGFLAGLFWIGDYILDILINKPSGTHRSKAPRASTHKTQEEVS